MTRRMDKEAEGRIVRGVEQVVDLIDAGWSPNDAIVKVAADGDYKAGHVRLMVQAYNTGRTNHQRKSKADLFEKTASFPVADAAVVLESLYPETVKTAAAAVRAAGVAADYLSPPRWVGRESSEKRAASAPPPAQPSPPAYPRDASRLTKRAFNLLRDIDVERSERRLQQSHARDKLASALGAVDDHFRTSGLASSYPAVRANASLLWGRPGEAVLDAVAKANPALTKQASRPPNGPVDQDRDPYRSIGVCVQAARDYGRLTKERDDFEKEAAAAADRLLGEFLPPHRPVMSADSILKKEASDPIPLPVRAAAGTEIARSIMKKFAPPDENKLKADAYADLTDPSHESRLRKIRTQSVLHDLMANDDFIGAEDPEKVTGLYNQINQLAPRAGESPILMQALMHRYLVQGRADPHDLDQLVGIETKLKQRDEPRADQMARSNGGEGRLT